MDAQEFKHGERFFFYFPLPFLPRFLFFLPLFLLVLFSLRQKDDWLCGQVKWKDMLPNESQQIAEMPNMFWGNLNGNLQQR